MRGMPRRQDIDPEIRVRLAAWTKYLMEKHKIPSIRQMAKRMGMAGPTVTNALNLQSGIGLDYVVALHRTFHESADVLLDTDPPKRQPE
jgi:antitoxin component HigA of HigAB toxin-antitoxin module